MPDAAAPASPLPEHGGIAVPPLDGEGPVWLQIRRSLARPILANDWPAGTRIPPELALSAHYDASRMTVNKAIQSLASEGLVERRPRIGTVVTARARERPLLEIWDAADAVQREGGHYGYRLIARDMLAPDSDERRAMALSPATPILRILCLHLADDAPFQLEERLVNVAAAPRIARQSLEDVSPGQWLLVNVPWTEVRHSISARTANSTIADLLAIAPGTACLVVERRTWNGHEPVTLGRFWYPGSDHILEARFRPSW